MKERGWRERLPAGASTAAAVRKFRKRSCGSRHCWGSEEIRVALLRGSIHYSGSEEIQVALLRSGHCCGSGNREGELLRERSLLRQWK